MADRYIPEHRRTQFKAKSAFKPEELRRRREEQQVEIRKQKREENLAKRRGIGTGENRPGASLGAAPDSDDENPPTESQVSYPLLILPACFCRFGISSFPVRSLFFFSPPPLVPRCCCVYDDGLVESRQAAHRTRASSLTDANLAAVALHP